MKNIIIGQSGGPTAVINSSLAGIYTEAKKLKVQKVYGMIYGITGIINDEIISLDKYLKKEENIELLKRTPGAFLGSCRYKLPSYKYNEEVYIKIFNNLEKYKIDAMFYIGGNDSMDTIKMLNEYSKINNKNILFIGVPKTIDNDLRVIDHCPGYASAAKYIITSLKEIIRDNSSFGSDRKTVCVVEIMGRHAGWLTASSSLAKDKNSEGVDLIYIPEVNFDIDEFISKIKELLTKKSSIVVAVSEGIKSNGKFVCELSSSKSKDAFGHTQLSGCATYLCNLINTTLGVKTRSIELSTLQRCAAHTSSLVDVTDAFNLGCEASKLANQNLSGVMPIINHKRIISYTKVEKIANKEKTLPLKWYNNDTHQMNKPFDNYLRPLIQGELLPIYKDGVIQHLIR